MRAVDVIVKKRDGGILTDEEIRFIVDGYVDGSIPDYQMSAFLMAVYFRGMNFEESSVLTRAMIDSGDTYDLSSLKGPLVDKHSTGGVGDKVSLILAPIAASCGIKVPMMSGRGLGHTGGTLDKLESIPGYTTRLTDAEFIKGLDEVGYCMIGQSERVVPADRKMYALRDVTGTVESIPLITASILSKKFAEGAQALVFDVKCGSGAFMKTIEDAKELAGSLVKTGNELGKRVIAVISDMNNPLGRMVGNFLEVKEAIDCLKGNGPEDLMSLTVRLTGWMLVAGGITPDIEKAEALCREKIVNGAALEKLKENVRYQHGNVEVIANPELGPKAKVLKKISSDKSGFVSKIDAYKVGLASVVLGAGRAKKEDNVLPGVGIELKKKVGERVAEGETLFILHGDDESSIEEARDLVLSAYSFTEGKVPGKGIILKEIVS